MLYSNLFCGAVKEDRSKRSNDIFFFAVLSGDLFGVFRGIAEGITDEKHAFFHVKSHLCFYDVLL